MCAWSRRRRRRTTTATGRRGADTTSAPGHEQRHRRREAARRRTRRRRRQAVSGLAGAVVLGIVAAGLAGSGIGGDAARTVADLIRSAASAGSGSGSGAAARIPAPPPELPRGGRRILPDFRVVGFYGAPQADELGILGIGTPTRAARDLRKQAAAYRRGNRPVLPAFELIATIAAAAPGRDGAYRYRQSAATIDRYLAAARRAKALLVLDIQPGRADFLDEVRAYRRWLAQPDVSLALDPEWSMEAGEPPGKTIGSVEAATVNRVSAYLDRIVRRGRLPQKLLLVHRFTDDMIERERLLEQCPGVALVVNVDGFGNRAIKIDKYRDFTRDRDRFYGFKLFYKEDTNLMTPRGVLALRPRPDVILYE